LRELVLMAEARSRAEWARTAALLALNANLHRDPKHRAFTPDDFNPFKSDAPADFKEKVKDLSILREVFVRPAAKS
jgi:hypothetical protein